MHRATATYYATCHCNMLLQYAIATRSCNMALQHTTATYNFNLPLQHTTATCHCNIPLQHASAAYAICLLYNSARMQTLAHQPTGSRKTKTKHWQTWLYTLEYRPCATACGFRLQLAVGRRKSNLCTACTSTAACCSSNHQVPTLTTKSNPPSPPKCAQLAAVGPRSAVLSAKHLALLMSLLPLIQMHTFPDLGTF